MDKSAPNEPAEAEAPTEGFGGLAQSIGSRNLIIAIVTMPLIFLAIIAAIVMAFGGDDAEEAAVGGNGVPAAVAATSLVPAGAIALPEGAEIVDMKFDRDILALRIKGPEGAAIVFYDVDEGAVIRIAPIISE